MFWKDTQLPCIRGLLLNVAVVIFHRGVSSDHWMDTILMFATNPCYSYAKSKVSTHELVCQCVSTHTPAQFPCSHWMMKVYM